ncbi:MAG: UDP-N-acetyl-D-mannosamine dehydrogenase [Synergistales bacterium]
MNVCVIGLGYVGLPLAVVLARSGHRVRGVDTDSEVIRSLQSGNFPGLEPALGFLAGEVTVSGALVPSNSPAAADVFVVAVPTPLRRDHRADLSRVAEAMDAIAPCLEPGNLVVIESTVPVGTTERMVAELLEKRPDLASPEGRALFHSAHCPERVLPGRILEELVGVDRVVGGTDPESTQKAVSFYSGFVKGTLHATDARTAEMCKLVENASRDVSIAFANEVSMLCARMGIDAGELIGLANRHPRVNILEPGPGVGGHCIPVDPWFLVESAPREPSLIRSARKTNERKTEWVLGRIREAASRFENPVIACLGLAYKPNVNDLRESPSLRIARRLCALQTGEILVVEPNIPRLPRALAGFPRCRRSGLEEALKEADVVALLTRHREFEGIEGRIPAGKIFVDPNGTIHDGVEEGKKRS